MIKIELRLFANLNKFTPENSKNYSVEDNITIGRLLSNLKINKDNAKIIFINGVKKDIHDKLKNNDRVGIFPPVGGG